MGSFNTTCFASMQTIAKGDKCYIFPIVAESGYKPVEVSLNGKEHSVYGVASSTCYSNCFWQPVGRLISATYDDCGEFKIDDTEENKKILIKMFESFTGKLYKTEQGENSSHDHAFDPSLLNYEKNPVGALEYMWDVAQEFRVFYKNYKQKPSQFSFAVVSKEAADYLFDMVNKRKNWSNEPLAVDYVISQMEKQYLEDDKSFFRFEFGEYFSGGSEYRVFAHWYFREFLEEQKEKLFFTDFTKALIRSLYYEKYFFEGLNDFNIKIIPIFYTSQDYSNEIGKDYAKFVNKVSKSICKKRKRYMVNRTEFPSSDFIKKVMLEKIKLQSRHFIPASVILDGKVEQWVDALSNDMVYTLETYFLSRRHTDKKVEKSVYVPLDWWQHVKERFAPKWFLNYYPVEYRKIDVIQNITTTNICPHLDVPKNNNSHVEFLMYGR